MHEDLFALQQQMDAEGVIFCFRGAVTQEVIVSLGDALRRQVELKNGSTAVHMRVFSAFIELVQNIDRYSLERQILPPERVVSFGIIVIGCKGEHYYIHCGNCIDSRRQSELHAFLTRLEGMNPQELKTLYKEQRRKDAPEESLGAGLGFIELARNAKSMRHSFAAQDDGVSFFSVFVTI